MQVEHYMIFPPTAYPLLLYNVFPISFSSIFSKWWNHLWVLHFVTSITPEFIFFFLTRQHAIFLMSFIILDIHSVHTTATLSQLISTA